MTTKLKSTEVPLNLLSHLVKVDYLLKKGIYTPEEMVQVAGLGISRVRSAISWLRALGAQIATPRGEASYYIEPFDLRSLVESEIEVLFRWRPN